MKLRLGQTIEISNRLVRKERATHGGHPKWEKRWEAEEASISGVFLGWRTLNNGIRYIDFTYKPTEYFRAALVCSSVHENPFYSTDIEEVKS